MVLSRHFQNGFIFVILILVAASCEKFSGDQTIPAYLAIDSVYVTTDYQTQGTASHKITDAWVYIDDELIGAFELPARFPVLKKGKHQVKVFPGIKKNGISATRVSYDFYTTIQKDLTLTPDSTTRMGVLSTGYQSTTLFAWKEDFDDYSITLDTTSRSTASIGFTKTSDSTFEGPHSAKVVLDSAHDFFEAQSRNEFLIPAAPVYLEMNFNLSNSVNVGVLLYGTTSLYMSPVITLHPTNGVWKKIYIDLTTTLNAYTGMVAYRVYLGNFKDAGLTKGIMLFDNIKLITRK